MATMSILKGLTSMNRWAARLSLWFWIIVLVVTLIFVPLCFGPVKAPQSPSEPSRPPGTQTGGSHGKTP